MKVVAKDGRMAKINSIPKKYRKPGVLHDILLKQICANWPRIRNEYTDVCDWLVRRGIDRDIDRSLLTKFRKDIQRDGAGFIDTPDGIGGRLKDWLFEAFPQAFDIEPKPKTVSFDKIDETKIKQKF